MRVIHHPDAAEEVREALNFYAARDAEVASGFLRELRSTVQRLREWPESGSVVQENLRRKLVRGFPYQVFYRLEAERIFILAVAHMSRMPGYWSHRARP